MRYIFGLLTVFFLCAALLSSHGQAEVVVTQEPVKQVSVPLEIIYAGVIPHGANNSLIIKIDDVVLDQFHAECEYVTEILKTDESSTIFIWQPESTCALPLVTYRGVNYILPIFTESFALSTLSDISTSTLKNTQNISTKIYVDFRFSNLRTRHILSRIDEIIRLRAAPFSLPIVGAVLPEKSSHLPNSSRPFRADSTDGIHHGWDFYTTKGTAVQSIEDGYIVHIKRDFTWSEMDHLSEVDSELARQENLDVYRGNTIYIKTLSGHVAIYAHMSDIPEDLTVGQFVIAGAHIGNVGDSAVPSKKYLYHLHFELAMNPFIDAMAGSYTHTDYLLWAWYGKGQSVEWVAKNDDALFVTQNMSTL